MLHCRRLRKRDHRDAPARGPDAPQPPQLALLEWLQRGGQWSPKVCVRLLPGSAGPEHPDGERGLFAQADIAAGEILLRIPDRYILSVARAQRAPLGRRMTAAGLGALGGQVYLAAYLLLQRRRPRSFFRPYLDTLPAAFPHLPLFLAPDQLALLQGSATLPLIAKRQAQWRREHELLCRRVPALREVTLDEYLWARCVVSSRTFALSGSDSRVQGLVPLADLLNHQAAAQAEWEHRGPGQGFVVQCFTPVPAGAEIRISYGSKCNSRLFLNYGFALPDNPHNEVRLPLRWPDALSLVPAAAERALKQDVLDRAGLSDLMFRVAGRGGHRRTRQMLSVLRFLHAPADVAAALCAAPGFDVLRVPRLSVANEAAVLAAVSAACAAALLRYPTTCAEDEALLLGALVRDARACVLLRQGEKRVLRSLLLRARALRADLLRGAASGARSDVDHSL